MPRPWNKGLTGLAANRPRNGADKTCEQCGESFYVPASQIEQRFCSNSCYLKSRWGDDHREERICPVCGASFVVMASDKAACCQSAACRREHKSRLHRGELSNFWRGGKVAPYHKDWRSARRAALERDGSRCTICEGGDRVQVHHVIPYRYSHSHAIENLVTLCRRCHSREELRVNPASVAGLRVARWPQQSSDD